eukprot:g3320.t1
MAANGDGKEVELYEETILSISNDNIEEERDSARKPLSTKSLPKSKESRKVRTGGNDEAKGVAVMSPRYRPPSPNRSPSNQSRRSDGSSGRKKKTTGPGPGYSNFNRAVRFEWQKYASSTGPLDVVHRSRSPLRKPSPGPGSHNVPTEFSPYVERKKSETLAESKNVKSGGESDADADADSIQRKLSYATTSSIQRRDAEGDSRNEGDGVDDFVRSSVRGNSYKIWESSSKKCIDKDGYEHTGHYVNVKSRARGSRPKLSRGEKYMRSQQDKSYDQLAIERIFDAVDVNRDGAISGSELKLFLLEQSDSGAAKALRKYLKRARYFHHGGNLFSVFDKNEDKVISRTEFSQTLLATEEKREISELFDRIDINHDGTITGNELNEYLKQVEDTEEGLRMKKYVFEGRRMYLASSDMFHENFDEIGERFGHSERSKVFRSLDLNDDGEITRHEFIRALEAGVRRIKRDERQDGLGEDVENKSSSDKVREIFRFYCNFGDRFRNQMGISGWTKMIRDCDLKNPKPRRDMLIDSANLTLADLGIIFNAAVRYQVTHNKHGLESWDHVRVLSAQASPHVEKTMRRINFTSMLYALRLVSKKRWPNAKSKAASKKCMETLFANHLLPLYDDDIAHAHSTFAKMEAEFHASIQKYKVHFFDVVTKSKSGKETQIGAKAFFAKHHDGLESIFNRYAALDDASAESKNQELNYVATSSWEDVKEINKTMDWLEFSTFLQDFGVFQKLATRINLQRIFLHFASDDFVWHSKSGKKAEAGKTTLDAMDLDGFCNSLGLLAMTLFDKDAIRGQCPTPRSKLELLFFKMNRPKWLLAASEKRMTNSIDATVRGLIMSDMRNAALDKFLAPKREIDDVVDVLESMTGSEPSPSAALFAGN